MKARRVWSAPVAVAALLGILAIGTAVARDARVVALQVSPATLQLGLDQGGRVTAHVDIQLSEVATSTVKMNGVPATSCFADTLGQLVAKFPETAIENTVSPGTALMTLEGATKAGVPFVGQCTVRVTVNKGK
ncbi:MAG: hypothetical protein FJX72_15925 [Armatimonadetes bacterium]|nr:hypothetical protein [Armatimonadota bacterium]